jgi:hypothetical protein
MSLTFRTQLLSSKRVTFMFSYMLDGPKLSLNCNLVVHGFMEARPPAYASCEKGDWLQLRNLSQDKRVNISDKSGCGDTLLHVSNLSS